MGAIDAIVHRYFYCKRLLSKCVVSKKCLQKLVGLVSSYSKFRLDLN